LADYRSEFIELALRHRALRFGNFTLKSGRQSPYFFDAGRFASGAAIAGLGRAYAAALVEARLDPEVLFGPAYKGIPLVTATAAALARDHGRDIPFAFNRKETKAHGEGGQLIGHPLAGRVLIVDDVITAGTAIRESLALIRAQGATPIGVLLALDRQERARDGEARSAVEEVRALGLSVVSILTLETLIKAVAGGVTGVPPDALPALTSYRERFGVPPVAT
jgi:orotate phosphoribosyltransferase